MTWFITRDFCLYFPSVKNINTSLAQKCKVQESRSAKKMNRKIISSQKWVNSRQKEIDDLKKNLKKLSKQQTKVKKNLAEAIARKLAIKDLILKDILLLAEQKYNTTGK